MDLRHECASRLVERGVPLAQIRDLPGHASVLTTERYDIQRLEALQAAAERLEEGKTLDPKTEAADEISKIFQDPTDGASLDSEDLPGRYNSLTPCGMESWCRYGDSNSEQGLVLTSVMARDFWF